MSDQFGKMTRQQIAQFAKDFRTLKALENVTKSTSATIPIDVQDVTIAAATAENMANLAIDEVMRLSQIVDMLIKAPQPVFQERIARSNRVLLWLSI